MTVFTALYNLHTLLLLFFPTTDDIANSKLNLKNLQLPGLFSLNTLSKIASYTYKNTVFENYCPDFLLDFEDSKYYKIFEHLLADIELLIWKDFI